MKLTKVAVSVVAVVAAVATGGSWYTGKQVEERYQQLISQSNTLLKNYGSQYGTNVEIKDVQIDRGFFSSDAKYRVEVDLGGEKLDFVGNDKIHHGPLPLNRLAKFNFAPVLMSMENNVQSPEQFKKMLGDKLGSGTANISYSGQVEGDFALSPIKFSDGEASLESSPMQMEYSYGQNASNVSGNFNLDNAKFKAEGGEFQIQGFTYEIQGADSQGYENLGLGEGNAKIKAIEFKSNETKTFQFKDIVVKGDNILKGDRVVSTAQAEFATLILDGIELGKFKMDVATDVDAKLMNDIMPAFSDPEAFESEKTGEMMLALLSKSLKFHINNFSLENSKGKATSTLLLNFAQFDPQTMGDFNGVLKALTSSKFTFNVNREYMEDIMRQVGVSQKGLTEEQAKADAEQEVNSIFASSMSGMSVIEGNNLKSEIIVDNGKVIFNGRELTEDELQMVMFMLMMGAGSLGH